MTRDRLDDLIRVLSRIHDRWIHYHDDTEEEQEESDRLSQDAVCGAIWRFLTGKEIEQS